MFWIVIQIAIGGALGAVGRYFTGLHLLECWERVFPTEH